MSTSARVVSVLVVAAAAAVLATDRPVTACGPDFPTNMIVRRADALATMWDGSFLEEAGKLVPASATDRAAFTAPPELIAATAREQALYDAAAEKFHAGDLAGAEAGFSALLRLPAKERRLRSVAAAFSRGRARYAAGKDAAAISAFREVRALVRAGFVDPSDLARASLGEEARVERERRGDLVRAVRVYAEQAALGGDGLSLLLVARAATATDRATLYRDDVGTRLLALYFYTRRTEISDEDQAAWKKELAKHVTSEARGAAYLAAAAYRAGEWDAAAALAKRCSHAPIATWVQAKLALRDGDRARAETLLREVERGGLAGSGPDDPTYPYRVDRDPRSLVRGELGLIALADARFAEAADWFGRGMRLLEASYVAERVMTLDELRAEVVRTRAARRDEPARRDESAPCDDWEPVVREGSACWARRVLEIYARRSMRAHDYRAALDAFGSSAEGATAKDFVAATTRADETAGIERARHLFAASRIMRRSGMEIAGTEVGPDWSVYAGDFERETLCMPSPVAGYTEIADAAYEDDYHDPAEGCLRPKEGDVPLVSSLEATRVTASAPDFDQRFAYRYVASRLAESAANLVPPRSPAAAELLCWAALYARRDRSRVDELYARYVRAGAAELSGEFGESCAEPDFRAAGTFEADQAQLRTERAIAKARASAWTWPRIRAAAWRRKHWLALPLVAFALIALLRRRSPPTLGAL